MAAAHAAVKSHPNIDELAAEGLMRDADVQMRRAFAATDKDGSGVLTEDEMLQALARVGKFTGGVSAQDTKVRAMVRRAAGKDGVFSFDEYKKFLKTLNDEEHKWRRSVRWLPYNAEIKSLYERPATQWAVACVIVVNFIVIIIEKEIDPYKKSHQAEPALWATIDNVCNVIFLVELLVNLYGHFWRPFVAEPWNYLDTLVVISGVFSLANVELTPPLDQIKILRALKILRLFKRIKSLNQILIALVRCIPGVVNAFIVLSVVMFIYAILGVDLFRDFGNEAGTYETIQRYGPGDGTWGADGAPFVMGGSSPTARVEVTATVSAMTARGFHYGQEYFGTFGRSLFTLFQVLTGESWSEAVARPLLFGWDSGNALVVGLYFASFILFAGIIMQNVVVTVLLDSFLATGAFAQAEQKAAEAKQANLMAGIDWDGAPAPTAPPPSPAGRIGAYTVLSEQIDRIRTDAAECDRMIAEIKTKLPSKSDSVTTPPAIATGPPEPATDADAEPDSFPERTYRALAEGAQQLGQSARVVGDALSLAPWADNKPEDKDMSC